MFRHKPAPGGLVGGHHPHLPTAHGLVEEAGCADLIMAEVEDETGAVLEIKRVIWRQMRQPWLLVGISLIPNVFGYPEDQPGWLPIRSNLRDSWRSWFYTLLHVISVFSLFYIFLGSNLGRQGAPWSFTYQSLLWKSYVNHRNTELASEIVRYQLEEEGKHRVSLARGRVWDFCLIKVQGGQLPQLSPWGPAGMIGAWG